MVAAGIAPLEYRPRFRAIALSGMTVLLALAGVVATVSVDEALSLVAGGIMSGLAVFLFPAVPRRPRHAAVST